MEKSKPKVYNPKKLLKRRPRKPGQRTLCDTIRDIYWTTNDPSVKARCEEAIVYAKKMNDRLVWYKNTFGGKDIHKQVYDE